MPRRLPARRSRCCCRSPGGPCCCWTWARPSRCAPSSSCSSRSWAPRSCSGVMGVERPRVGPAERRRGAREGHAGRRRGARAAARASTLRRSSSPGTSRAAASTAGEADVVVTDGFTGNVAIKLMEGTTRTLVGRDPRRDPLGHALEGRRPADPGPARRAARRGSTPRRSRAPTCSACAAWWSCATAPPRRRAIANAIALADRAVEEDVVGRTGAALGRPRRRDADAASVPADTLGAR